MYSFYIRKFFRRFFSKKATFIKIIYKINGIMTEKRIFRIYLR